MKSLILLKMETKEAGSTKIKYNKQQTKLIKNKTLFTINHKFPEALHSFQSLQNN